MGESGLAGKHCVPCRGGVPPLEGEALNSYLSQLSGWRVEEGRRLEKSFDFPDFVTGLAFVNRVGEIAEREGHHPYLGLTWGKVDAKIWTHKIDGLTESDFILAAKIDKQYQAR
jgi:4a-hydroxytetrahydrobiopterin dehydratase